MSWFFFPVAPSLLMLGTLALERLESGLNRTVVTAAETLLAHAETQPIPAAALRAANPRFRATHRRDRV